MSLHFVSVTTEIKHAGEHGGWLLEHVFRLMVWQERMSCVVCCCNVMCTVAALQKSHSPAPCPHQCCRVCWILTLRGRTKDNTTVVCGKHIKCVISETVMWMYKQFVCLCTRIELAHVVYVCWCNISRQIRGDRTAVLTQSEWGWTQCCGCGPWCLESSCSAAYTPSCSLWSRPGAGRRSKTGVKRWEEGKGRFKSSGKADRDWTRIKRKKSRRRRWERSKAYQWLSKME